MPRDLLTDRPASDTAARLWLAKDRSRGDACLMIPVRHPSGLEYFGRQNVPCTSCPVAAAFPPPPPFVTTSQSCRFQSEAQSTGLRQILGLAPPAFRQTDTPNYPHPGATSQRLVLDAPPPPSSLARTRPSAAIRPPKGWSRRAATRPPARDLLPARSADHPEHGPEAPRPAGPGCRTP